MKRNPDIKLRFPAYFRHDWMNKRREQLGLSVPDVSRLSGVTLDSTRRVFTGEATSKQVFPIAQFLKMDWKMIHDLNLSLTAEQFHRAVLTGGSRSGGESGAGPRWEAS